MECIFGPSDHELLPLWVRPPRPTPSSQGLLQEFCRSQSAAHNLWIMTSTPCLCLSAPSPLLKALSLHTPGRV